ncbi:MAG: ligase-associated DNA damage response endonuclease PdeM [Janthinobacterium lividum]
MSAATSLQIQLAGQPLHLCVERAAYDPLSGYLLVADVHFGKGAVFRARGVPVPAGTTADNLRRLDSLIARHAPTGIVFLGDFLHAHESQGLLTTAALLAWRARHASLRLVLVTGNHDRHAGAPAALLGIEQVEEPFPLGPWALCHHPQKVAGRYVLAGHEHPGVRLSTRVDALRVPCFALGVDLGVLPAFGAFTGLMNIETSGKRIYLVADDRVVGPLPNSSA